MILSELNMLLVNVARSNYLVNDAFCGDVYTINGKENRFGCFVATPMNALKQNIGYIRYTYVLYYIDRLTKAEDNIDYVQSDAVTLLNGVIDFIGEQGIEVESGYEFTLFRQKFSDWCAGAYVTVHFYVPYNDCGEGEFNVEGLGLGSISIDKNGIYEPDGVDGYNRITVNVPQVGATEEWVDDEIELKLQGYATESWVEGQGFLTEHQDLSQYATISYVDDAVDGLREELPDLTSYATKNWTNNQGFLKTADLEDFATQDWVENQGFLKEDDLSDYADKNWVDNNYVSETELTNKDYATRRYAVMWANISYDRMEEWVNRQNYVTPDWIWGQHIITEDALEGYATETWVRQQGYITDSALEGYATRSWVGNQGFLIEDDLCDYATKDWVNQQGYLVEDDLCGYATEEWTRNWVENQGYIKLCDLDPYATKNWVENQGFLRDEDLDDYATKDWVLDQNFATETWVTNQNYATQTWVENQEYLTDVDLDGYATETWVQNQGYLTAIDIAGKLDSNLIWKGTIEEWEDMTEEERCSYLIAMIVEE